MNESHLSSRWTDPEPVAESEQTRAIDRLHKRATNRVDRLSVPRSVFSGSRDARGEIVAHVSTPLRDGERAACQARKNATAQVTTDSAVTKNDPSTSVMPQSPPRAPIHHPGCTTTNAKITLRQERRERTRDESVTRIETRSVVDQRSHPVRSARTMASAAPGPEHANASAGSRATASDIAANQTGRTRPSVPALVPSRRPV